MKPPQAYAVYFSVVLVLPALLGLLGGTHPALGWTWVALAVASLALVIVAVAKAGAADSLVGVILGLVALGVVGGCVSFFVGAFFSGQWGVL